MPFSNVKMLSGRSTEQKRELVEALTQAIVDTCLARNIACGITAGAADMPRRIEQGFSILGGGRAGGGLPASVDRALQDA